MAVTRALLPAPILIIPPVLMTMLEKLVNCVILNVLWPIDIIDACRTKFLMRRPRLHLPIHAAIVTLSFGLALPVAIALFPQISQVSLKFC